MMIDNLLLVVALGCALALAVNMSLMIYTAYNNPDKTVLVRINQSGEADTEVWLVPIITIFIGIMFIRELRRLG